MYTKYAEEFKWDAAKAASNFRKHHVTFEEAAEAVGDPNCIFTFDNVHSSAEERFRCIGMTSRGLLTVILSDQDDTTSRIISARPSSQERNFYCEKTGKN